MLTRSKIDYSNIKEKDFYTSIPCEIFDQNDQNDQESEGLRLGTVLLFDIESYEITINNNSPNPSKKWVPHQISWAIYDYKDDKLIEQENGIITLVKCG